jgi:hypothetical protein
MARFVGVSNYCSSMSSCSTTVDGDAFMAVLDDIDAAYDKLATMPIAGMTPFEIRDILTRREKTARRQPALAHPLLNKLVTECPPIELGATTMAKALAHTLKISVSDAKRRLDDAAALGPRTTLTGETLEPALPNVARAQAAGLLGPEHLTTIRSFFKHLPTFVDLATRIGAEAELATRATQFGPEHFRKAADRLMTCLDQDGTFTDKDRARRRGLTKGKQGHDGMTPYNGNLDPEAAAIWEAIMAKYAAPGMCNPDDDTPCTDGHPTDEQIHADTRTAAQRQHDALKAAGRIVLSTGKLGHLNGLPVTVIVSTTLAELESAAGHALTAGGTLIPMADLIRMAAHAHHYLAIFDGNGRALHLGRSKRIASPDQRIVLYAKDRGCTAPGCTAPAYHCQVHHATTDWADGGTTDINNLTLACGPDNRKAKPGGWTTRKRADGRTEWIPPPHLDDGGPRINDYHHPENMLIPPPEDQRDDGG